MTSLKHKTISGIKWVMLTSVIQRVLSFGATIILARLLSPADYGLFALAFVMIDGFGIFKSLGFDSALVRRKEEDIDKAANTAFFLIPAMGMILFAILFFMAPFGARALGNPQVAPVIRTLGVVFVISCFGKVPQTILYRSMQFKYKSIAEVSAQLVYVTTAVALAFNKFGVWSLVVAYVLKSLVQVSIEWFFSGWCPSLIKINLVNANGRELHANGREYYYSREFALDSRKFALKKLFYLPSILRGIRLNFDPSLAKEMFHFGKFILVSGIVGFIYSNLDNLVIGKLLGVTMLGYYAIARNASNLLNEYILGKVGMIMYPAYSQIQEDKEDVRLVMVKALRYISIIALPFSFGVSIFAPEILRFVFGAKWLPATGILRILPFAALLGSLGSAIWPAFLAKGQSKTDFQITLANVLIFFALIIPLTMKFKLVGVGIAALLSAMVGFSIGLIRIKRLINIRIFQIFEPIKTALLCSLLMLMVAVLIKSLPKNQFSIFYFLLSGILSAGIYLLATYFINRNLFKEMKEIFA